MAIQKKEYDCKDLTRREFIKKTGVACASLGTTMAIPSLIRNAHAAKRDYILIGHPNPSTGPLAGFGEASPWTDMRAIDAINKEGGIYIEEFGKKIPVKLKIVDTESNPTKAAEKASTLILKDKVDLMIALHTVATVNPVSGVCERFGIPCIASDSPVDSWLSGNFRKWVYHAFWTVDSLTDCYIGMWDEQAQYTNKVIGFLFPNDETGVQWSEMLKNKLPPKGYKVIDPGRFPALTSEFSPTINLFKNEKVDIIAGCVVPPDFATFWKQCHQQGFIPKIVTMGKGIGSPADVNSLGGNLPLGLTTEVIWSPAHPFKILCNG